MGWAATVTGRATPTATRCLASGEVKRKTRRGKRREKKKKKEKQKKKLT